MKIEGSVIQKCYHGIYLESPEAISSDKATYCTFCTPEGAHPDPNWEAAMKGEPVELDGIQVKRTCKRIGQRALASIRRV